MVYANSTTVMSLFGNKTLKDSAGVDITTAERDRAIDRADSRVNSETGYYTWASTDSDYNLVVQASELFAACFLLKRFHDTQNKKIAMEYEAEAMSICQTLKRSSTKSVIVASRKYVSYPINRTSGSIHRSLVGTDLVVNGNTLSGD